MISPTLTTDSGADVKIYRFKDFLGAGTAALISTSFAHVLDADERTGWRPNGEDPPLEYAPGDMAIKDWFDHHGEVA